MFHAGREMILFKPSAEKLTPEQQRVIRAHWEWSGRYAMLWIIVTILIFAGVSFVLDYLGADDSVRTLCLVLLVALTLVNAVWRAAGMVAARIELMIMARRDYDKPS
jgi:hypothetical protein